MPDTDNPLNEEHYQQIIRGLEQADKGLRQIARAKSAGIDLSAMEKEFRDTQAKLTALRQVYFPGR